MKRVFAILGQFLLFLVVEAVGLVYHPFNIRTTLSTSLPGEPFAARSFVWDGLVLTLLVYVLVLVLALLRKRFGSSAPWCTLALALALASGYLLKFGFLTVTGN